MQILRSTGGKSQFEEKLWDSTGEGWLLIMSIGQMCTDWAGAGQTRWRSQIRWKLLLQAVK